MTAATFPLDASTRQSAVITGDGATTTFGPFGFKIFDVDDVEVMRKDDGDDRFTLRDGPVIAKLSSDDWDGFTVTFPFAVPASSQFYVRGARVQTRSMAVRKANQIDTDAIDKQLTQIAIVQQENTRDLDRTVTVDRNVAAPTVVQNLVEGNLLVAGPDQAIKNGPAFSDLEDMKDDALTYRNQARDARDDAQAAAATAAADAVADAEGVLDGYKSDTLTYRNQARTARDDAQAAAATAASEAVADAQDVLNGYVNSALSYRNAAQSAANTAAIDAAGDVSTLLDTYRAATITAKNEALTVYAVTVAAKADAVSAAISAQDAAADATAAAQATGPVKFFDTYAAATAGLGTVTDGTAVEILADENHSGLRTRYVKTSGAYVFKLIMPDTYQDMRRAPVSTGGASVAMGLTSLGAPVQLVIKEEDIYRRGASGDPGDDATAAVGAAIAALRSAGGGALLVPQGTHVCDEIVWDYLSGGYGKLRLIGDGVASVLKKRNNDGAPFITVGRNSGSQTFQGSIFISDLAIDGISAGTERVLDLWSLTTLNLSNVRVRYGARAVNLNNCVTCLLVNVEGSNSGRGLTIAETVFGDTTTSAPNLNTIIAGAFKDNSVWGIDYNQANQLVMLGTQVENNGTIGGTDAGGLRIGEYVGVLNGSNRLGTGVTAEGAWFEASKGAAAVLIKSGMNLFSNCHFVANANVASEVVNDGGIYNIRGGTITPSKAAGNVKDTSNAKPGNVIDGTQINSLAGIDPLKTEIRSCGTGNDASAYIVNRAHGKARYLSQSADNDWFFQEGASNDPSGTRINFDEPFASTPRVQVSVGANVPNRVYSPTYYSVDTTGFTLVKSYMDSGDATVKSDLAYTVWWRAEGEAVTS